ncbi:MAG: hypothetical protein KatS3mg110_0909 [Pirellulaceae bacterium]|nr:MAG: hypothetical protein KatS3mg110_0909 [Pirellulaceae bacterium]
MWLSLCEQTHVGRREFLRVGGLALGGLSLPQLLAVQSALGDKLDSQKRSVIFVFLHGGPTQFETFDPKMEAPPEIRSATGEIATSVPGLTFGSTFPRLAAMADRLLVVRSFRTGDGNHDIKPVVGVKTLQANLGSLYARVVGTHRPSNGMPVNCALFPRAVDPDAQPPVTNFGRFDSSGSLGAAYAPFVPGGGGELQADMELRLPRSRLEDRRGLLARLDRLRRSFEASGWLESLDQLQQQAFQTVVGGVAEAFDLSRESPQTLARYDTAPLVAPQAISRRWNNYKYYVDNAQTLGKLLLLARRLCEAGCGFVTVTTGFVWDMHADQNNAGVEEGMQYMGPPLDHALSALIEDIHARGLQERILVVVTGEMGRTPRINNRGGRDHWGGLAPLLLAGGGLPCGAVVGQSSEDGGRPASEPRELEHLMGTIFHHLLDIGQVRLRDDLPRELVRVLTECPTLC